MTPLPNPQHNTYGGHTVSTSWTMGMSKDTELVRAIEKEIEAVLAVCEKAGVTGKEADAIIEHLLQIRALADTHYCKTVVQQQPQPVPLIPLNPGPIWRNPYHITCQN